MSVDIVFSFDSTGSMYPAISELRRKVQNTIQALFNKIPDLRIGLIAHGDYNDRPYQTKTIHLTNDQYVLTRFIQTVETTNGFGNGGECYEQVIHEAGQLDWRADKRAYVMLGDEPAHYVGKRVQNTHVVIDWRDAVDTLLQKNIIPYVVRCLNRSDSRQFHAEMSTRAGTPLLSLAQFADVEKLITALVYKQHSDDMVQEYGETLQFSGGLSRNVAALLDDILGNTRFTLPTLAPDLLVVDPSRFQVLHVDNPTDIKSFVLSSGAQFRKGRGFYELTKREEIQERKEIVLQDRVTGDFFSGPQARNLIGIPYGKRATADKHNIPGEYRVFVQSTSVNRKLMPHTTFLYDTQ